ncbi:flagellar basal body-associated FliL family protein [Sphingorhabdus sp. EL138]|jgi:flagellar FliL protein|uniref:flagellar basal body-associated FliL family protein n=1 Tax=Sphingorhabdus sp. EL138 TaxID=2073156 RepID=UPI0025D8FF53|nr:flagellar basal body-associated FliL family protein [Sphingorhabdus sp. EL138]
MAEPELDQETDDLLDPQESDGVAAKRKRFRIIAAALVLLLLIAGGLGYYFLVMQHGDAKAEAPEEKSAKAAIYVPAPEMIVNLRTPDGQSAFLKINFAITAHDKEAEEMLKERMPEIRDALQPFLRELRPEDLAGSAGVFRIKEEMTRRVKDRVGPDKVDDILIQDLIQQ